MYRIVLATAGWRLLWPVFWGRSVLLCVFVSVCVSVSLCVSVSAYVCVSVCLSVPQTIIIITSGVMRLLWHDVNPIILCRLAEQVL